MLLREVDLELGRVRGWKSFEVHDRKNLDCLEETVGRNVDVKGDSGENSERKEESYKEIFCNLREYIYCHEQNVEREI